MAPSRNRELYPDNIVIVPKTGDIFHCRVPVVDWPHAHVGASWVDPGFFARVHLPVVDVEFADLDGPPAARSSVDDPDHPHPYTVKP